MEEIWTRLETWLESNAPELLKSLHGPADEAEILEIERALGVELPTDVKQSYRRHNGQHPDAHGIIYGYELLPLRRIREEWSWLNEQPNSLYRAWIPLTKSDCDYHFLDMDPRERGTVGQIIEFRVDQPRNCPTTSSFRAFMNNFVLALESGDYLYPGTWRDW